MKSRTGFIIMFMKCTLTWFFNLKYRAFLITMESEYVTLSKYMSELIGIREFIKQIKTFAISRKIQTPKYITHSKAFFIYDIPASKV